MTLLLPLPTSLRALARNAVYDPRLLPLAPTDLITDVIRPTSNNARSIQRG